MKKNLVTLFSVAILASASGVLADEISLGGDTSNPTDNTGLVVVEQPTEEPVTPPKEKETTKPIISPKEEEPVELGKDEKTETDNTGLPVVEEKQEEKPQEQPKEEKQEEKQEEPKEEKQEEKKQDEKKQDEKKVEEQKKKAEDNTGVKHDETPKPLTVQPQEIKKNPVETNTGHKIVSTNQGKVVIENPQGQLEEVEPYEVGAVKQSDGTIAVKDKDDKLQVLPNTGMVQSALSLLGFLGLFGTLITRFKVSIKNFFK